MDLTKLGEPFKRHQLDWTGTADSKDKASTLWAPYVDARAVAERFDEVCGPENWQVFYAPGPNKNPRTVDRDGVVREMVDIMATISVRCGDDWSEDSWVMKSDGSEAPEREPVKGGYSMAFRRAAVAWGVGRYLYSVEGVWLKGVEPWNVDKHAFPRLADEAKHPDERGKAPAPDRAQGAAPPAQERPQGGPEPANPTQKAIVDLMARQHVDFVDLATFLNCEPASSLDVAEACDMKPPELIQAVRESLAKVAS